MSDLLVVCGTTTVEVSYLLCPACHLILMKHIGAHVRVIFMQVEPKRLGFGMHSRFLSCYTGSNSNKTTPNVYFTI